jgi:hypothetical protein
MTQSPISSTKDKFDPVELQNLISTKLKLHYQVKGGAQSFEVESEQVSQFLGSLFKNQSSHKIPVSLTIQNPCSFDESIRILLNPNSNLISAFNLVSEEFSNITVDIFLNIPKSSLGNILSSPNLPLKSEINYYS